MTDENPTERTKPLRGRPALSDDELLVRREEIAKVALHLFRQEGFASVSMRRIGREVGLAPMALYRYFPSKLAILTTLWDHVLGEAFKDVKAAASKKHESEEKLRVASHSYVDYWFRNVEHYHLVFMNSGVTNKDVTSFVAQESVIRSYEIFFENVAKALDLPHAHERVKNTTDCLICHLHGIMHSLITMQGYDWTARTQLVDMAVDGAVVR